MFLIESLFFWNLLVILPYILIICMMTDIITNKVYNFIVLPAIFWFSINNPARIPLALIIPFLIWYFKIWKAGDSKMLMMILLVLPYEYFVTYFLIFLPVLCLITGLIVFCTTKEKVLKVPLGFAFCVSYIQYLYLIPNFKEYLIISLF